ncbi:MULTISPECIES: hypothetical protein [unclassified Methanosarcina]|nr:MULTISPECIES: hypothetical protein [unclassified Methanosarcina]
MGSQKFINDLQQIEEILSTAKFLRLSIVKAFNEEFTVKSCKG